MTRGKWSTGKIKRIVFSSHKKAKKSMAPFRWSLLISMALATLLLSGSSYGATTSAPAVTDTATVSLASTNAATDITTAGITTIDSSTNEATETTLAETIQSSVTSTISEETTASITTSATQAATTPSGMLGPDQTNGNTQPDPLGGATTTAPTIIVVSTEEPTTSAMPITTDAPQTIPSTATPAQPVNDNPYSDLPRRPWQLNPSSPGQQPQPPDQNPLPWLFYGRDFFPFIYLLSNSQQQQQLQQNSGQPDNRNLAPLYAYGMDMDLWPWSFFFNQNRGQQQNQQQNTNFGWPQNQQQNHFVWQRNQQQNNFGWPQNQQRNNLGWSQNQRNSPQVFNSQRNRNSNSLANLLWLGEF
ncbi:hypothetical protein RRG08_024348 [Elysia crispata]|uniref:Uncharacterized protein n=1 Tax=Elysia crispata TaxID=231223 RepID=A0AAE1DHU9_9GAST|nr:hypothetical protein RRG08_024348 [Elysia crispata]